MRAAKWKFEDAKKRIKGTIDWRREYKPELIKPADVGIEAETGKMWVESCRGAQESSLTGDGW